MVDTDQVHAAVAERFPLFGPNKRQEMARLVYEIAKRETLTPRAVLDAVPAGCTAYPAVKDHLTARRFPVASARGKVSVSFTAIDITPSDAMPLTRAEKVPAPPCMLKTAWKALFL